MDIYQEPEELFGKENIIYPDYTRISHLDIDDNLKNKIVYTGLPKKFERLNFTMDFDPILKDEKISSFANHPEHIYTIGFDSLNYILPSSIGLDDNESLAEINSKLQNLHNSPSPNLNSSEIDYFEAWFRIDFEFAQRFCVNFSRNGEIIIIDPSTLSSTFVNSDLKRLLQTLIVIQRIRNTYSNMYADDCFTSSILRRMDNEMIDGVRKVDPTALKDENCSWYLYFQETVWETERLEVYEKMQLE
jgi:hypothetical protein